MLKQLCAFDLLGFQTNLDRLAFEQCATLGLGATIDSAGVLEHDSDKVRVGTFPIGIDVEDFGDLARHAAAGLDHKKMRESLDGRAMIIGVDRLDYSKGLVDRVRAYECFLVEHPESLERVTYLQITPKSREQIDAYEAIARELEETIAGINGRHGTFDWVPVRYMSTGYPRKTLAGFFQLADLALVTPLRDGMNLVAKEFVAAQLPHDPGVLVLSKLAGAATHVNGALLVNPHDEHQVAEAIHRGLNMTLEERTERHAASLAGIRKFDIAQWRHDFTSALRALHID